MLMQPQFHQEGSSWLEDPNIEAVSIYLTFFNGPPTMIKKAIIAEPAGLLKQLQSFITQILLFWARASRTLICRDKNIFDF